MNEAEEIKNRLNVADVISEYIQLTPAGVNFKAKCPFHNEKTPSFYVSQEKQIWHCFGCSEGGDIFTFVQKMEGIDFREALKILASRAGVELKQRDRALDSARERLIAACDWARRFYAQVLNLSGEAKIARDYLDERKIGIIARKEFFLGYSPQTWQALLNFLKKKGFSEQEIFSAGLAAQKNGKYYDRFRGRLMFPIWNVNGETIGFGARVLDPKNDPMGKYINSPQSLVYDKSRVLYGINLAKQEMKNKNLAVVVEGYMDVISSHEAGIKNVVSVSGTALTSEQINLIKRYTRNIALCFDADEGGKQATKRGLENILGTAMSVRIITLPKGEDPDSLIKKSVKSWEDAVANSRDVFDFYFDLARNNNNPQSLEGKKAISSEILPLIQKAQDPIERAYNLQRLASLVDMREEVLRESLNKIEIPYYQTREGEVKNVILSEKSRDLEEILAERLVGLGFFRPDFWHKILEDETVKIFKLSDFFEVYKVLQEMYNKEGKIDFNQFKNQIQKKSLALVSKIEVAVLAVEKDFGESEEAVIEKEILDATRLLKEVVYKKGLKKLHWEIERAEEAGEKEKVLKFNLALRSLTHNLNEFEKS